MIKIFVFLRKNVPVLAGRLVSIFSIRILMFRCDVEIIGLPSLKSLTKIETTRNRKSVVTLFETFVIFPIFYTDMDLLDYFD